MRVGVLQGSDPLLLPPLHPHARADSLWQLQHHRPADVGFFFTQFFVVDFDVSVCNLTASRIIEAFANIFELASNDFHNFFNVV